MNFMDRIQNWRKARVKNEKTFCRARNKAQKRRIRKRAKFAQKCDVCGRHVSFFECRAYRDETHIYDKDNGFIFSFPNDPIHFLCTEHYKRSEPKKVIKAYLEVRDLTTLGYPTKSNSELSQKQIYYWKRLLKNCLSGLEAQEQELKKSGEWIDNTPWERRK